MRVEPAQDPILRLVQVRDDRRVLDGKLSEPGLQEPPGDIVAVVVRLAN